MLEKDGIKKYMWKTEKLLNNFLVYLADNTKKKL